MKLPVIILSISFTISNYTNDVKPLDYFEWLTKFEQHEFQQKLGQKKERLNELRRVNTSKVELFAKAINNSLNNFKINVDENSGDISVDEISDLSILSNYERELYNAIIDPAKSLKLVEMNSTDKEPLRPIKKASRGIYNLEIKLSLFFGDKSSGHQKEIGRVLFGSALREFNTGSKQEAQNFEVASFYAIYDMNTYEVGSKKVWQFNTGVSYTRTINLGVIEYKYMDHIYFKVNMHKDEAYRNNLRATQGSYMPVQVWKK